MSFITHLITLFITPNLRTALSAFRIPLGYSVRMSVNVPANLESSTLARAVQRYGPRRRAMRILSCFGAAVLLAASMAASQDLDRRTQTKVEVKDGKNVTVTGCLERSLEGGYMLTNVAGKDGPLGSYLLATEEDDLAKHVGHRMEVTGKAADQGTGKIEVETKNETRVGDDKTKTQSKAEVKGDLRGLPYLGVKSMRMLATVCP